MAATCVAVIAAIGYFFYGEYSAAVERQRANWRASARANCLSYVQDAEAGRTDGLTDKITECLLIGALSHADLDASMSRMLGR